MREIGYSRLLYGTSYYYVTKVNVNTILSYPILNGILNDPAIEIELATAIKIVMEGWSTFA